jgi:hypothetical protein
VPRGCELVHQLDLDLLDLDQAPTARKAEHHKTETPAIPPVFGLSTPHA